MRKRNAYWLIIACLVVMVTIIFCIATTTIQARADEMIEQDQIARERYREKVSTIENESRTLEVTYIQPKKNDILAKPIEPVANSDKGGWECENKEDAEYLACVIYQEAGGDGCCDMCRRRVADIVLNRVKDARFAGDTVEAILTEGNPPQWGLYSVTGIIWPEKASYPEEAAAVERARRIAIEVLEGNHSDLTEDYIWCAEFPQGQDVIECDGIYFGK